MRKMIIVFLLALLLCYQGFSQDGPPAELQDDTIDEEALFNSDEPIVTEVKDNNNLNDLSKVLLVSDRTEIGGFFGFNITESFSWMLDDFALSTIMKPENESLGIELYNQIYIDARPNKDFRVFTKFRLAYPFIENEARTFSDIFSIKELFSDYNWNNTIFFRGGKQTIKWGVGYFFKPADILNITQVDPQDPDAQQEGPVSLKLTIPIGLNNIYLYTIADNVKSISDLKFAPKIELLAGSTEIGIGGVYRYDMPVYAMATLTTSLLDVNIFCEASASYGSVRNFILETEKTISNPIGLDVVTKKDEFFFIGTAGGNWSKSDDEQNLNFSLTAQYLYNGEGYADGFMINNKDSLPLLIVQDKITIKDLMQTGKHYYAVMASLRDFYKTGLTFSAFVNGNLSDQSMRASFSVSYEVIDNINLRVGVPLSIGQIGSEYANQGQTIGLQISASTGNGSY